ncbi:MAG: FAD-binding oxidoreductase [Caldilineaceae bacterium]|nr:FAD-binding oxidoreductase [Caldilineaceae bacterium]
MITHADVVVIGAGSFGASTAYHLARRGKRVVVLDAHAPVTQTSPRAAGLTQQIRSDAFMTHLAMQSVRQITELTAESGVPLAFHQHGSIKLAMSEGFAAQIYEEVERGQGYGLPISQITHAEAQRLAPFLHPDRALAIWYTASDLYLEPGDLPRAYLQAAQGLGATVLAHTPATGIGTRAGKVDYVETPQGRISTATVVDTAGAWTRVIGALAGINVPLLPVRHQLYITRPLPSIAVEQPIVRILDYNIYVRPEQGGLMVGGYEPDPLPVNGQQIATTFQISELALDITPLRRLSELVYTEFPLLREAEVAILRGGLPTMTPDGRHIVDQAPGVAGFFVASGCCVGGLAISPAVGTHLADWVVDGTPPQDLSPLSLNRFGPAQFSEERLQTACLWRYAHHYSAEEAPM